LKSLKVFTNESYGKAEAEETMPEHQLGFRRMLAGIYTHTSGHIVAAPMAHYNAINESRFRYSHTSQYLPVFGLEGIIKEQSVTMRFRNLNGTQVAFHKALNYLYRPKELEHMPSYQFYSETEFVNIKQAEKDNVEFFEYTEEHVFRGTEAVRYREIMAVPTLPWNWVCSTRPFLNSLLDKIDSSSPDYHKKEEYAFRFMILFVPFRNKDDLKVDESYQEAFQNAYKNGSISEEMINIAKNIQTIHNSLASGIPENSLSAKTVLIEAGDFGDSNDEDDNSDDLLASIGELFATMTNGDGLKKDSTVLDLDFGKRKTEEFPVTNEQLENVIEFSNSTETNTKSRKKMYYNERYYASTQELNTLALKTTITRSQATANPEKPETEIINANGTWQSISKWGQNDGLDDDQQTAFEILAATYVLSFYDEAILESSDPENYNVFLEGKSCLFQLARRNCDDEVPLCMFITGPAGAGKCKSYNGFVMRMTIKSIC